VFPDPEVPDDFGDSHGLLLVGAVLGLYADHGRVGPPSLVLCVRVQVRILATFHLNPF
jgi:hypothetical protein